MAKSNSDNSNPPEQKPVVGNAGTIASAILVSASARRQMWFWFAALVATALFLFIFRSILLPFIAGMALAYLLDPVADGARTISGPLPKM